MSELAQVLAAARAETGVVVETRGEWLIAHAALGRVFVEDEASLLLQQASSLAGRSGGVKLAIGAGDALELRAELALDPDLPLVARARETCAELGTSRGLLDATAGVDRPRERAVDPVDLPGLLAETFWSAGERSSDRLVVDLGVPRRFRRAVLVQDEGGVVHVTAEVARARSVSPASRVALARVLLDAGRVFRLVRPVAIVDAERTRVTYEVVLTRPVARELDHALAALSVACRLSGEEIELVLDDEELARRHLSLMAARNAAGVRGETTHEEALGQR